MQSMCRALHVRVTRTAVLAADSDAQVAMLREARLELEASVAIYVGDH